MTDRREAHSSMPMDSVRNCVRQRGLSCLRHQGPIFFLDLALKRQATDFPVNGPFSADVPSLLGELPCVGTCPHNKDC